MVVGLSFLIYKWWEIDDKIKRFYIELLVEKLLSLRKIGISIFSRKFFNGKDVKIQLILFFKRDIFKVIVNFEEGGFRKSKLDKREIEDNYGKYIFEIIIMDILVKYEYIKSLRKRVVIIILVSFFESIEKVDCIDVYVIVKGGYKDNKERIDKFLLFLNEIKEGIIVVLFNGYYLIFQKLSSVKNDLQGLKIMFDEQEINKKVVVVKKVLRVKLVEIFEYIFLELSESLVDEIAFLGIGSSMKKFQILFKLKDDIDNKCI